MLEDVEQIATSNSQTLPSSTTRSEWDSPVTYYHESALLDAGGRYSPVSNSILHLTDKNGTEWVAEESDDIGRYASAYTWYVVNPNGTYTRKGKMWYSQFKELFNEQ